MIDMYCLSLKCLLALGQGDKGQPIYTGQASEPFVIGSLAHVQIVCRTEDRNRYPVASSKSAGVTPGLSTLFFL